MNMRPLNKIMLDQWLPVLLKCLPCRLVVTVGEHAGLALIPDCRRISLSTVHLAEHEGVANFYKVSLPAESGLLSVEDLRICWPNLKIVNTQTVQVFTLDHALEQYSKANAGDIISSANWLWLGCLPAMPVLRGATHTLANLDVVLARVVLANPAPQGADLHALKFFLEDRGFKFAGVQPERNPALGTALFIKNHKAMSHDLSRDLAQLQQAQWDLQAQLAALSKAKALAQQQCEVMANAQTKLHQQLQEESQAKHVLDAKLAQIQQACHELQNQLTAESQAKALAQQQCEVMVNVQTKLHQQLQEESQAKHVLDAELAQIQQAWHELQNQLTAESQAKALAQQQCVVMARKEHFSSLIKETEYNLQSKCKQVTYADVFFINHGKQISDLCDTYGSDKGSNITSSKVYPWLAHNYSVLYEFIIGRNRNCVLNILECGIGTNNPALKSNMTETGQPGASLRMWRDFFPDAKVVGLDIDADVLFEEDRITTYQVDQCSASSILNFTKNYANVEYDLIVDDGLHEFDAGISLFQGLKGVLAKNGIYVIEDISRDDFDLYISYFSNKKYKIAAFEIDRSKGDIGDNRLLFISNP